MNIQDLRGEIKTKRLALSPLARQGAATHVVNQVTESGLLEHQQRIALYWDSAGEMPTQGLLDLATRLHKECYLPVIDSDGNNLLHFAPFHSRAELQNNRFGIPEPLYSHEQLINPEKLELVFVPLVAIDRRGNRVGMGKGYYDHTFQFMLGPRSQPNPILVGLAYEFQLVDSLVPQRWDVPLTMLITEKACYDFRRRKP